ncbi:hypothetical protein LX16_3433 [Stackebrandtia albiflava]|uniref:Uncharacterized protein n=1 Tax=Stackebrandtia albiflava TaxID=406432 RepID=A0A562V451_9ACTN|nr:hypothetical protein [Stackebrandtia albiflava]TWJ12671.1 hypothetical protein LX16_3433 [Stackebrandtia albiflava]
MPPRDFSAEFDDLVARQLADVAPPTPGEPRIEVAPYEARFIEEALSGLEQTNGQCEGFDTVKGRLLRNLWIRGDGN